LLVAINLFSYSLFVSQLVCGSLFVVWLTTLIDKRGIGNGTSLIIFSNIISSLLNKKLVGNFEWTFLSLLELCVLFGFIFLICLSQSAKINIEVVSARQLSFLKNNTKIKLIQEPGLEFENKEVGLLLRLNQAGIFPLIIASNLLLGAERINN
jgi:preprotein translocase subunit SecY